MNVSLVSLKLFFNTFTHSNQQELSHFDIVTGGNTLLTTQWFENQ